MRKMFSIPLAGLAALMILGVGGFVCGDKDRSAVMSSDDGEPGAGILKEGVVGRVTVFEGYPVEGAFIQARSLGASGPPVPDIAILSDSQGRYSWPLLTGVYELSASAEGYETATGRVTVKPGQVVTLNFSLKRAR